MSEDSGRLYIVRVRFHDDGRVVIESVEPDRYHPPVPAQDVHALSVWMRRAGLKRDTTVHVSRVRAVPDPEGTTE